MKTKLAGLTAGLMAVSLLLPILAFAAPAFKDLQYRYGTVTGTVYDNVGSDVYGNVTLNVYSPGGDTIKTVTLDTYTLDDTYRNYDISTVINNVYPYVHLGLQWEIKDEHGNLIPQSSSVTTAVYNSTPQRDSNRGGGGGGGGYPSLIDSNGKVNASLLEQLLKDKEIAELEMDDEFVLLPASALANGNILRIIGEFGSYDLPLKKLDYEQLAKDVNTTIDQLYIRVGIGQSDEDTQRSLDLAATAAGLKTLSAGVDFSLQAVGPQDNQVKDIQDFGKLYVTRTMWASGNVSAQSSTVALYDPVKRTLQFVPSTFEQEDGQTQATFQRNGNSTYVIVGGSKSFGDLNGHWAKTYVDLLANKLVVDGVTDTTFEPDRSVTRAEFAALAVRSLGLTLSSGSNTFKDVRAGDWYNDIVATAAQAGLVEGYEDGTFRPNASITREELAAMVVRAMNYAGQQPELTAQAQLAALNQFTDSASILWGQREMAIAINTGIVDGMTDQLILPGENATRAQAATMLNRYLKRIGFMN